VSRLFNKFFRSAAGLPKGMTTAEALAPVRAARRAQDVVITTMSAAKVWMDMGPLHPLDHVFVPSCMSHATSVGLGIALAQPERRVYVLNGDGSMLMNLGSLVTIGAQAPKNLAVIVLVNGVYEVTGSQPIPGGDAADFVAIAAASGFQHSAKLERTNQWNWYAAELFDDDGPAFVELAVVPDLDRPAPRSPGPAAARAQQLRTALLTPIPR